MRRFVIIALFCALWPTNAAAQGFIAESGSLFLKAEYASWSADQRYAGIFDRNRRTGTEPGDPIEFDSSTGGEFTSRSFALTAELVPVRQVRVGVYFPAWQQSSFRDLAFDSTTTGTGDVWLHAGYGLVETTSTGTAVDLIGKIPTTTLPAEFQNVPLSEGQFDIGLQHTTSWRPVDRIQLDLRTLYRHRRPFEEGDRSIKPGDEFEVGLGAGVGVSAFWFGAGYEGLWSQGTEDRSSAGAITLSERRQIHEARASVYVALGKWIGGFARGFAIDVGARAPLGGQDYPRGLKWRAGLAWSTVLW